MYFRFVKGHIRYVCGFFFCNKGYIKMCTVKQSSGSTSFQQAAVISGRACFWLGRGVTVNVCLGFDIVTLMWLWSWRLCYSTRMYIDYFNGELCRVFGGESLTSLRVTSFCEIKSTEHDNNDSTPVRNIYGHSHCKGPSIRSLTQCRTNTEMEYYWKCFAGNRQNL